MKTRALKTAICLLGLVLAGCSATEPETDAEAIAAPADPAAIPDQSDVPPEKRLRVGPKPPPPEPEVVAMSFGRGIASGNGVKVTFKHNVTQYKNETIDGTFVQSAMTEAGTLDIEVDVTCAVLDGEAGRAWIAGKVSRNGSTNPLYAGKAGAEAWFAILDRGKEEQTAWITLPKFAGKGVTDAAAFCKKKPWNEDDLIQLEQGALGIFP